MSKNKKTKAKSNKITTEDDDIVSSVETVEAEVDIKNQNQQTFNSRILSLKKVETLNRLTKYEKARIIGTRAAQIQNGMSAVFIKDGKHIPLPDEFKDVKDSVSLAKLELKHKSSPLIIRRVYPSGKNIQKTIQELD